MVVHRLLLSVAPSMVVCKEPPSVPVLVRLLVLSYPDWELL